jgi:hypothetical protein
VVVEAASDANLEVAPEVGAVEAAADLAAAVESRSRQNGIGFNTRIRETPITAAAAAAT